jgi:DNA-binding PadR family transcriptional regulator
MAEILGTFEQAILVAVVRLGATAYGRTVFHELQDCIWHSVSAGAVYTTLDRLENRGLVRSKIEEGPPIRGGRPRRYYSITPEGARALNDARQAMTTIWKGAEWPVKATT